MHQNKGLFKAENSLKNIAFVTLVIFATTFFTPSPSSLAQTPYSNVPDGNLVPVSTAQVLDDKIEAPSEFPQVRYTDIVPGTFLKNPLENIALK